MMLLPLAVIFVVLFTATARTWLISGGLAVLGCVSYFVFDYLKRHGLCCHFDDGALSPPTPGPLSDLERSSPGIGEGLGGDNDAMGGGRYGGVGVDPG